jgi:GMP synthase (glutamine-hydrolysing)
MRDLSVVHQEDAATGVFADALAERDAELTEWVISNGAAPDGRPEGYEAVLIFGGGMHVDQEESHPWLRDEEELIRDLAVRGVPMLGVCLGAQLIAKALGARVGAMPAPQIGWFDVEQTPEASDDPVFAKLPRRFASFQWHSYAFELPSNGVPLARDAACLQAYRAGEAAWGIQFHAELTRVMMQRWVVRGAHRFELPGAQPGRDHLGGRLIWDMHLKRWLGEFLQTIFGKPALP